MKERLPHTLTNIATDRWFGLATIACSGLLYSIHWQKTLEPTLGDPGPTLVPSVVAVLLTLLGLALLIKKPEAPATTTPQTETLPGEWRPKLGALSVALVLAYAWLLPNLGYPVSTALFFGLSTWVLGELSLKAGLQCTLIAIAVALITHYLLGSVLNVSLPEGEWWYALKGVLNA